MMWNDCPSLNICNYNYIYIYMYYICSLPISVPFQLRYFWGSLVSGMLARHLKDRTFRVIESSLKQGRFGATQIWIGGPSLAEAAAAESGDPFPSKKQVLHQVLYPISCMEPLKSLLKVWAQSVSVNWIFLVIFPCKIAKNWLHRAWISRTQSEKAAAKPAVSSREVKFPSHRCDCARLRGWNEQVRVLLQLNDVAHQSSLVSLLLPDVQTIDFSFFCQNLWPSDMLSKQVRETPGEVLKLLFLVSTDSDSSWLPVQDLEGLGILQHSHPMRPMALRRTGHRMSFCAADCRANHQRAGSSTPITMNDAFDVTSCYLKPIRESFGKKSHSPQHSTGLSFHVSWFFNISVWPKKRWTSWRYVTNGCPLSVTNWPWETTHPIRSIKWAQFYSRRREKCLFGVYNNSLLLTKITAV